MYWPKEPYDANKKKHKVKYTFKIGDRVRTTFLRRPFQREYDTRWSGEIFKISRRFMRQGQTCERNILSERVTESGG